MSRIVHAALLLIVVALVYGCAQYSSRSFVPREQLHEELPLSLSEIQCMITELIDDRKELLKRTYDAETKAGEEWVESKTGMHAKRLGWGPIIFPRCGGVPNRSYAKRFSDAQEIINGAVKNWGFVSAGDSASSSGSNDPPVRGKAIVSIRNVEYTVNRALAILTIFTLAVPSLMGVPVTSQTAYVDVEMSVLDMRESEVKQFAATGKGTARVALYWGYKGSVCVDDDSDVSRAAHAKAVRNAMDILFEQINTEMPDLMGRLAE